MRNDLSIMSIPGDAPLFDASNVGGVPFLVSSPDEASDWLISVAAVERIPVNVRLANAYNVALASKDSAYRRLLTDQGMNFPDGTPVVWFMNMSRSARRAERVRGPSLFIRTIRESVPKGTKHFLLGAKPETLTLLENSLLASYPGIVIAGSYSPPFAPVDKEYVKDCADKVRTSDADLVWVGLGTPKQDFLGTALARELSLTTVNVGAAFDFAAGTVREAPYWIQRSGFEWLYRLLSEPRRLWRRYVFGNARFLTVAILHRIKEAANGGGKK